MARQALALKYRPQNFEDVVEQGSVVKILRYMIENKCFPNVMLFCGSAGCGKTTMGRIMSKLINEGKGTPIEVDAASNNSVENMRRIIEEAKVRAIDAEYKVYILDEVHQFSNSAWQAFLKTCEEPPAKTIFILCTTDPQKIPNTIHSRVQRFDFNRITYQGIVDRLKYICDNEIKEGVAIKYEEAALDYIAKLSQGGMRDAITNMDKALNYSLDLNVTNVINALGLQDYETFFNLTFNILKNNPGEVISLIEETYLMGKDLKIFLRQYLDFLLDVCKYEITTNFKYIQIPEIYIDSLNKCSKYTQDINRLREVGFKLNQMVKYETSPKALIESQLISVCYE